MRPTLLRLVSLLVLGTVQAAALAEGAAGTGDEVPTLEHCLLCHGGTAQGNAAVGGPRLAGMPTWYLKAQLQKFRTGARGSHAADIEGVAMRAVALSMRDPAAEDAVLAQVAAMTAPPASNTIAGEPVRGRDHYASCAACHGPDGAGNHALGAPALAPLNDWYLQLQLRHFRDGVRGAAANDGTGAQMRAAMAALPDDGAIADVVAYIRTLGASPRQLHPQASSERDR
jgi:cytochrome c553